MKYWDVTVQKLIRVMAKTEHDVKVMIKAVDEKPVCFCAKDYGAIRVDGKNEIVSIQETDKWPDVEVEYIDDKSFKVYDESFSKKVESEISYLEIKYQITTEEFLDNKHRVYILDKDRIYWKVLIFYKGMNSCTQ